MVEAAVKGAAGLCGSGAVFADASGEAFPMLGGDGHRVDLWSPSDRWLADQPGNLHGILGQFSARNLNLTKLESRPTKQGLGSYCFLIDVEGHIGDEVMADCLRELHATLPALKFLGSYPAAGADGPEIRRDASAAWQAADLWVKDLRSRIDGRGMRATNH
jgi:hypothetical protein